MHAFGDLSLTTVLFAVNGWLISIAQNRYARWIERKKYGHFRLLVIGRMIQELDNIFDIVTTTEQHEPVVRSSDIVLTALIDARFVADEIPRVFSQAVQDTRGRFAGLVGKLSQQFFNVRFISAVQLFFEPGIRIGGTNGSRENAQSK